MIVYLAGDIPAFVMYCVNGGSGLSLLIESTDSMIESTDSMIRGVGISNNYEEIYSYIPPYNHTH